MDRDYTTNGLNQYEAAGSAGFCYDNNGNLTADGGSVYLYDVENRLVEKRVQANANCAALSYAGALEAHLRYDTMGRLYYLRDYAGSNGITRFTYDGDAMVAEYNSGAIMLRRSVHGTNADADDPLVWYEGSSVQSADARHLYADPHGSIVLVVDANGVVIAQNTFDEYGINGAGNAGRFQYTGQAWLPELGMYYYKARIYSPTLGRFLQVDPIGYDDQFNLYNYVGNDPTNGMDPTGMYECTSEFEGGCEELETFYNAMTEAASNPDTDPSDAAQITDVLSHLGPPGSANADGDVVQVLVSVDYAPGGQFDVMGTKEIIMNPAFLTVEEGASLLAHEGDHSLFDKQFGTLQSGADRMHSESRAYRTSNALRRAIGEPELDVNEKAAESYAAGCAGGHGLACN